MRFATFPKTASKVFCKHVDADIDVYYVLPASGKNYTRVYYNRKTGSIHNGVSDVFSEDYFNKHIRRSVRAVPLSTWNKVKASIKKK